MVRIEREPVTGAIHCLLTAHASLSPRQIAILLGAVALVMASIALGFASLGLWPVLPFSGLEWLALVWAFRLSLERSRQREVLSIDATTVRLERGRDRLEPVHCFQRAWLAVDWRPAEFRGHARRVVLRSHGREFEVGSFLAEAEREQLVHELRRILKQ